MSIPVCFQTSELYLSLVENGEDAPILPPQHSTFELPPLYPHTVETLIHQLETVQFWCLDEIPQYIFTSLSHYEILCGTNKTPREFPALTENKQFMDFLEIYEYKQEIRLFLDLDTYGENKLTTCVKYGFKGLFKYLFHNVKQDIVVRSKTSHQKIRLENKILSIVCRCQKTAAEYGQIEMLQLLLQIYIFINLFPNLREQSAKTSNKKCMEYLISAERECGLSFPIKWTKMTCYTAAKHGNIECLELAHKSGAECNYEVACVAAKEGHFNCYKYLCDNGCPLSANKSIIQQHICDRCCWLDDGPITREMVNPSCKWNYSSTNVAAANGHCDCLKYGIAAGCITTNTAAVFAAKNFHPDCLFYLIEIAMKHKWNKHDYAYSPYVILFLIQHNKLEIIQKLWETYGYCPFDPNHPNIAARSGNWETAYYIMDKMDETGQKYSNCLARNACYSQNIECIKKMEERGFELDHNCLCVASNMANVKIFMYVAKKMEEVYGIFTPNNPLHQCIIPDIQQNILYNALTHGNTEIIQYSYSRGFRFDGNAGLICIRNGDFVDCLEFVLDNYVSIKNIDLPLSVFSAKYERLKCLKLLHEKYGYSLEGTLYWAISNNNLELLNYVWEEEKNSMTRDIYDTIIKKKYKAIRDFIGRNMNVSLLFTPLKI